jgi:ABC-2 type transport system permease protein
MSAAELRTEIVAARRFATDEMRTGLAFGLFFALTVYASAAGYVRAYSSTVERLALQTGLGNNVGLSALFGRPRDLTAVGGFTAWRSEGVLLIVGGIWGAFLGARMFRGGEEQGRWEYVLAGRTRLPGVTRSAVGAVGAILASVWLLTLISGLASATLDAAGFGVSGATTLATELVGPAVLIAGVAAVTSQIFHTRRRASASAAAVFGILFVGRMVFGVYPGAAWLRWADPLVWFDSAGALANPTPGWALGCFTAAVALAGHRDLGDAFVTDRPAHRTKAVTGVTALGLRLTRASAAGWLAVVTALTIVVGVLAGPVSDAALHSPVMQDVLNRVAGRSSGARAFLGLTMLTITTLLCLCAATMAAGLVEEEMSGRLEHLLAEPVRRVSWLVGRIAAALGVLVTGGVLVGVALWTSSTVAGTVGIPLPTLLAAGANLIPAVVVVFSIGITAYAVRPRSASVIAHGVIAASFAVELVGSLVRAPHWLLDLSVLHHIALAPAVSPRWGTDAILLGIALILFTCASVLFRRRDLVAA